MGSRPAPRDVMPLDIGQFLMDTHHLTPTATLAYLHLKIQYWRYGPLPGDAESLAAIAQLSADAWSIAQVSIKHLFSIGSDGLLHQALTDQVKDEVFAKHQRAKEKAQKAARARWDKEKAKRGEIEAKTCDAPSIPQASAKHEPSIEDVSPPLSLKGFPHTPFLEPLNPPLPGEGSRRSPEPPSPWEARARTVDLENLPVGSSPGEPGTAEPGVIAGMPGASSRNLNENKAKTQLEARRAPGKGRNGATPHRSRGNGLYPPQKFVTAHAKKGVRPADVDFSDNARFEAFRGEVFAYWRGQNPEHPDCPWMPADRRSLLQLLDNRPELNLEKFRQMLEARAVSGVNPAQLPRHWLARIEEFSAGPLDRFSRLARSTRAM